jgi:hypothetical protein
MHGVAMTGFGVSALGRGVAVVLQDAKADSDSERERGRLLGIDRAAKLRGGHVLALRDFVEQPRFAARRYARVPVDHGLDCAINLRRKKA